MKDDEFRKMLIEKLDDLGKKIDALVQVVAISSRKERMLKGKTKTEQIIQLSNLGLSRTVVAWIVGTTPEVVSVRLSEMKNKEKKRERKAGKESGKEKSR